MGFPLAAIGAHRRICQDFSRQQGSFRFPSKADYLEELSKSKTVIYEAFPVADCRVFQGRSNEMKVVILYRNSWHIESVYF